jgi:hypothetical protein
MVVLLITGAIDLSSYNVPATIVTDVGKRLSEYVRSIEYAIDHYKTVTHIIFCENTSYNYDYSDLIERARLKGKLFESLLFSGDYFNIQLRGKGYGEGEIIRYALDNSQYLNTCQSFYKLTGRLIVKNMDSIIRTTSSGSAFDFHPGVIYNREKDHIETLFYKADRNLYQRYLYDAYREVDETRFQYLEHIFCQRLSGMKVKSFRVMPDISGDSGTTGKEYDKPYRMRLLEKVYYMTGIHNLQKNVIEKFLYYLIIGMLSLYRCLKRIIFQERRINLLSQ